MCIMRDGSCSLKPADSPKCVERLSEKSLRGLQRSPTGRPKARFDLFRPPYTHQICSRSATRTPFRTVSTGSWVNKGKKRPLRPPSGSGSAPGGSPPPGTPDHLPQPHQRRAARGTCFRRGKHGLRDWAPAQAPAPRRRKNLRRTFRYFLLSAGSVHCRRRRAGCARSPARFRASPPSRRRTP
jgi:hypothetical protein